MTLLRNISLPARGIGGRSHELRIPFVGGLQAYPAAELGSCRLHDIQPDAADLRALGGAEEHLEQLAGFDSLMPMPLSITLTFTAPPLRATICTSTKESTRSESL